MTSTDVAVRTDGQQLQVLTNDQLSYIATTEFVPPGLRGNLPAILACVATGRALGIPDMTALRSIHVIDGKATFSAELMVMLARQRGHSIQGEVSEGSATVTGKRADNGDTMTVTWTLAMAERAGLVNKSNWKKYPEAMLWARAVSQLCRELFADCFAGATYTPEELGEPNTNSAGEPVAAKGPTPPEGTDGVPGHADPAEDDLPEPLQGDPTDAKFITDAQAKKLNLLVGKLRAADRDPTGWIYSRFKVAAAMVDARENEDRLHWSAIRPHLSRIEATDLIDKLSEFVEKLEVAP